MLFNQDPARILQGCYNPIYMDTIIDLNITGCYLTYSYGLPTISNVNGLNIDV